MGFSVVLWYFMGPRQTERNRPFLQRVHSDFLMFVWKNKPFSTCHIYFLNDKSTKYELRIILSVYFTNHNFQILGPFLTLGPRHVSILPIVMNDPDEMTWVDDPIMRGEWRIPRMKLDLIRRRGIFQELAQRRYWMNWTVRLQCNTFQSFLRWSPRELSVSMDRVM